VNVRNMLNLRNAVQVRTVVETSDGMGGLSAASSYTTLARASLWCPSSNDSWISDKITKISSHVLALEYEAYTFTDNDREILFNGNTYKITGHADNVGNRDELIIVGLQWLS
jgi:hypothetical protein